MAPAYGFATKWAKLLGAQTPAAGWPHSGEVTSGFFVTVAGEPDSQVEVLRQIREARASNAQFLELDVEITELPDEIGTLSELEHLIVDSSALRKVTPCLWQLRKLQSLTLGAQTGDDCELSELPPGISQLSELRELLLGGARVRSLPPDITRLTNLEDLRMGYNDLTAIPAEVFELASLRKLYLHSNRIGSIPSAIGRLRNLQHLDVGRNELTTLPAALGRLPLVTLDLAHNPLAAPLPELAEQGTGAILSYLKSLEDDGIPIYEAKILLTGEGEVGKTSLVRALRHLPYKPDLSTTHGIELAALTLKHPTLDACIVLNLWDFGGQEVYRITHQFFFSRRSLYLIVWKPRQGEHQNAVEQWLRLIRLRVGSELIAMIVATHADERRPELDVPYLQHQFGPVIAGQWLIDSKSGRGVDQLAAAIIERAATLPQMGFHISERWLTVRDELKTLGEPQIAYDRYCEMCRRHGLDDSACAALADLLHDLGHIVYFSGDEGLRDVLVLQPEWLTKAIGYVLEDEQTRQNAGELNHSRLGEIWQPPGKDPYDPVYYPYFLRLMEKFDMSYRIPDTDRSLIAQLVPYERPAGATLGDIDGFRDQTLLFELAEDAPGLIAWITVRTDRFATGTYWRRGALLEHRLYASRALIELVSPLKLMVRVRAPSPMYMFGILRDTVEDLIRVRWPGLEYQIYVPCPEASDDGAPCTGRFRLTALERLLAGGHHQILCQDCLHEIDVAGLITGFATTDGNMRATLDRWETTLDRIERGVASADDGVKRMEAIAADAAVDIRTILKVLATEVTDCPRLATMEVVSGLKWDPQRLWRNRYRLQLWCEHPGYEHRCEGAGYPVDVTREWLQRAAPYIAMLAQVIRLLPIASGVAGVLADGAGDRQDELNRVKAEIELMAKIGDLARAPTPGPEAELRGLSRPDREGLRALRELLFRLDPSRGFGGLRRVLTPAGDYLWICPDHYSIYDPGLPDLSGVAQHS
jgi:internalin A